MEDSGMVTAAHWRRHIQRQHLMVVMDNSGNEQGCLIMVTEFDGVQW